MRDFRITDVELDGQEVYFTLLRNDGVKGLMQLNMWSIIHNDWTQDIAWRDEK